MSSSTSSMTISRPNQEPAYIIAKQAEYKNEVETHLKSLFPKDADYALTGGGLKCPTYEEDADIDGLFHIYYETEVKLGKATNRQIVRVLSEFHRSINNLRKLIRGEMNEQVDYKHLRKCIEFVYNYLLLYNGLYEDHDAKLKIEPYLNEAYIRKTVNGLSIYEDVTTDDLEDDGGYEDDLNYDDPNDLSYTEDD